MAAPSAATGVTLLWLLLPTGLLALVHGTAADAAEVERVELEEAGLLGVSLLQSYGHLTQASVTASTRGSKTSLAGADQQSEHQQPTGSSTCGMTAGKPKVDCDKPDMGSCGNACCAAEFRTDKTPSEVFALMTRYLESGGSDGLFGYKTGGTSGLGISGGADQGTWDSIFQGTHTTIKMRYVDTLNFAVRTKPEGRGSVVRAFSISDIAGALGDEGQNRRTVSLVGSDLGFGPMSVLFGCGDSPSLPEVTGTALMLETGTPGVSMEPAVADSARLRELSFVALGSAVCTLMAVRLRKSIGGHVLTEAQREQAPYQRVM